MGRPANFPNVFFIVHLFYINSWDQRNMLNVCGWQELRERSQAELEHTHQSFLHPIPDSFAFAAAWTFCTIDHLLPKDRTSSPVRLTRLVDMERKSESRFLIDILFLSVQSTGFL